MMLKLYKPDAAYMKDIEFGDIFGVFETLDCSLVHGDTNIVAKYQNKVRR